MRADNDGEGGILALLALVAEADRAHGQPERAAGWCWCSSGLFGASLLYGDGMITPAISVLGAIEGLQIATPVFEHWVVPITLGDPGRALPRAAARHRRRRRASSARRRCSGSSPSRPPGCPGSCACPRCSRRSIPAHARRRSSCTTAGTASCCSARSCCASPAARRSTRTWATSGAGRSAWPGSASCSPRCSSTTSARARCCSRARRARSAIRSTRSCRAVWIYPMVAIATIAAVVASQALISGAFSLTNQAVQLGYCPRVRVVHTSGQHEGQIYVPEVNTALMIACLARGRRLPELVGARGGLRHRRHRHDDLTSVLFFAVMRERWGLLPALLVAGCSSPSTCRSSPRTWSSSRTAAGCRSRSARCLFTVLTTWKRGRRALGERLRASALPLEPFLADLATHEIVRVPGTAVFMTSNPDSVPPALLHHFKHNKSLHERVRAAVDHHRARARRAPPRARVVPRPRPGLLPRGRALRLHAVAARARRAAPVPAAHGPRARPQRDRASTSAARR